MTEIRSPRGPHEEIKENSWGSHEDLTLTAWGSHEDPAHEDLVKYDLMRSFRVGIQQEDLFQARESAMHGIW